MFMCFHLVTEVKVLLHVDDVGHAMLIVLLDQLQNFHLCHRLCKPDDWLRFMDSNCLGLYGLEY